MTTRPRLHLPDDVVVEITKRSTNQEDDIWARYMLLLRMASSIIDQAPASAEACEDFNIMERMGDDLQCTIETMHRLFTGGLYEAWWYYLPERMRENKNNGSA